MGTIAADVGRVLWLGFDGIAITDDVRAAIADGALGAALLFQRNLATTVVRGPVPQAVVELDALVALTGALHAAASDDAPILVGLDQEGGAVQRLRAPATQWPPMLAFEGRADDVELAAAIGVALGRELAALGIDVDFAPVLDIHTNPANPIIGDRAFGTTAATVTRRALALAAGLARAGVLACG